MAVNDLPAIWQKERTSENLTCMTCILPAALSHLISLASLLSFTVGCCAYQLLLHPRNILGGGTTSPQLLGSHALIQ